MGKNKAVAMPSIYVTMMMIADCSLINREMFCNDEIIP